MKFLTNQHNLYHCTIDEIFSQKIEDGVKPVGVGQNAISNFYSRYEWTHGKPLDEWHLDCYLHHNFVITSQSQYWKARVKEGSDWKILATKTFQFWDIKTQQLPVHEEKVSNTEAELSYLLASLNKLPKTYERLSKLPRTLPPRNKKMVSSMISKNKLTSGIPQQNQKWKSPWKQIQNIFEQ